MLTCHCFILLLLTFKILSPTTNLGCLVKNDKQINNLCSMLSCFLVGHLNFETKCVKQSTFGVVEIVYLLYVHTQYTFKNFRMNVKWPEMVYQKIDNYWAPGGFSYPLFCLSFSQKKERLVSSLSLSIKQIFSWNDCFFPKVEASLSISLYFQTQSLQDR